MLSWLRYMFTRWKNKVGTYRSIIVELQIIYNLQSDDVIVDGFEIFTFMSAQLLKVGLVAKLDMA